MESCSLSVLLLPWEPHCSSALFTCPMPVVLFLYFTDRQCQHSCLFLLLLLNKSKYYSNWNKISKEHWRWEIQNQQSFA